MAREVRVLPCPSGNTSETRLEGMIMANERRGWDDVEREVVRLVGQNQSFCKVAFGKLNGACGKTKYIVDCTE